MPSLKHAGQIPKITLLFCAFDLNIVALHKHFSQRANKRSKFPSYIRFWMSDSLMGFILSCVFYSYFVYSPYQMWSYRSNYSIVRSCDSVFIVDRFYSLLFFDFHNCVFDIHMLEITNGLKCILYVNTFWIFNWYNISIHLCCKDRQGSWKTVNTLACVEYLWLSHAF